MIAQERERFGRELHDGTIQAIYGAGLALEDMSYTVEENPALAREKARRVMGALDEVVADIRRYILDLRSLADSREFESRLVALARYYGELPGLSVDVEVISEWRRPLSAQQAANLLQLAREAIANVARHAQASRLGLTLRYARDAAVLEIRDDGQGGVSTSAQPGADALAGQGLRNITRG